MNDEDYHKECENAVRLIIDTFNLNKVSRGIGFSACLAVMADLFHSKGFSHEEFKKLMHTSVDGFEKHWNKDKKEIG